VAKFGANCDIASSAITENSGRVGIGTPSAAAPLEVSGKNAGNTVLGGIQIDDRGDGCCAMQRMTSGNTIWDTYSYSGGDFSIYGVQTHTGATGVGSIFNITDSGNVGIGTTNPVNTFQVHTGTNQDFTVLAKQALSSGVWVRSINDAANAFEGLQIDGAPLVFNTLSGGNVGIGTATPTSILTVAGTIQSTGGGFKFPDGTVQATATLQGPQGKQGPQGPPGPPGSTTNAICVNDQTSPVPNPCTGTTVSYTSINGQGSTLDLENSCSVTANTGSCTASAGLYYSSPGNLAYNYGACAVCK
jgi:hypothetical protein